MILLRSDAELCRVVLRGRNYATLPQREQSQRSSSCKLARGSAKLHVHSQDKMISPNARRQEGYLESENQTETARQEEEKEKKEGKKRKSYGQSR